jgi:hypothetical protein
MAVLCCAVLCCAVLCCAVLRRVMSCRVVSCCVVFPCVVSCLVLSCCVVSCSLVFCTAMLCSVLPNRARCILLLSAVWGFIAQPQPASMPDCLMSGCLGRRGAGLPQHPTDITSRSNKL